MYFSRISKNAGQTKTKWNSSSISPMLQNEHLRSFLGKFLYLPFSTFKECAPILYLHNTDFYTFNNRFLRYFCKQNLSTNFFIYYTFGGFFKNTKATLYKCICKTLFNKEWKMLDIANFLLFPEMPKTQRIKFVPNFACPICTVSLLFFIFTKQLFITRLKNTIVSF